MQFDLKKNNINSQPKHTLSRLKRKSPLEDEPEDITQKNYKKKLIQTYEEIAQICKEQKLMNKYNIYKAEAQFYSENDDHDTIKIKNLLLEAYSYLAKLYLSYEIYKKSLYFCKLSADLGKPLTELLGKVYLNLGHELKGEEDNKAAAHFYKLALSQQIQDDEVRVWLGNYYCSLAYKQFLQHNLSKAIEHGLLAIGFGVNDIRPWIGQCYFQLGENDFNDKEYLNALASYKNAIIFGANYSKSRFAEGILLLADQVGTPSRRSIDILEKIYQYLLEAVGPHDKPLTLERILKKLISEHCEFIAVNEKAKENFFFTSHWLKKAIDYSPEDNSLLEKLLNNYERLYRIIEKEKSDFKDNLEKRQDFIDLCLKMGEIYYKKKQYWKAKDKYLILKELGERIDDKLSQCYYLYANLFFNNKQYKTAIDKYIKALTYNFDPNIRQKLLACYIADGDDQFNQFRYQSAQESFTKAKEISPSFPILNTKLTICELKISFDKNIEDNSYPLGEKFFQLGNLFREKNQFFEADKYLNQAKIYGYDNDKIVDAITYNKAESCIQEFDFKNAEIFLNRIIYKNSKIYSQLFVCHEQLGDEFYFNNDFERSIFYYKKAIKFQDSKIITRRRLAECQYYHYKNNNKQVNIETITDYCVIIADCFVKENNLEAAIRWYRRVFDYFHTSTKINVTQKFIAACKEQAKNYLINLNYQQARELLEEIYSLIEGDRTSIEYDLAKCLQGEAKEHVKNKNIHLAIQYFEKSLKLCKDIQVEHKVIQLYLAQAENDFNDEKYSMALHNLKIVLKSQPENKIVKQHIAHCNKKIGIKQYNQKKFKSAFIYLEEYYTFEPDHEVGDILAKYYLEQGVKNFKNNELTEAKKNYDLSGKFNSLPSELIAAKQSEVSAAIKCKKGNLCFEKKDYTNAIAFYLQAVRSHPNHDIYTKLLIKAYIFKGHDDFSKTISNPSHFEVAKNSYLEAINWSKSIQNNTQKFSWIYLRLAIIYINQDKYQDADKVISLIEIKSELSAKFLSQLINTFISLFKYCCKKENLLHSPKWLHTIETIVNRNKLPFDLAILGSQYKILADIFLKKVDLDNQICVDKAYLDAIYYYQKAEKYGVRADEQINKCQRLRKALIKKIKFPQDIQPAKKTPGENPCDEIKFQNTNDKDLEVALILSSATFLFEKKQFQEAIPLFKKVCSLGISTDAILNDLAICYQQIGDLFFKTKEYLKALEYYTSSEIKYLGNLVSSNLNDGYYHLGIEEYNKKNYHTAINFFKKISKPVNDDKINTYVFECEFLINSQITISSENIKIKQANLCLSLANNNFKSNNIILSINWFEKYFDYGFPLSFKDKGIYVYCLLNLANQNYELKNYSGAEHNYQKVLNYGQSNLITKKLLSCYFNLLIENCEISQFELADKIIVSARKLLDNECIGQAYNYFQQSNLIQLASFLETQKIDYKMMYILLCKEKFYLYRPADRYVLSKENPNLQFNFVQPIKFDNITLLTCIDKYFYVKLRFEHHQRDLSLCDDSISSLINLKLEAIKDNLLFLRILINFLQPDYFDLTDDELQAILTNESCQNNRYYGDNLSDDSDDEDKDFSNNQDQQYEFRLKHDKFINFLDLFITKIVDTNLSNDNRELLKNKLEDICVSSVNSAEREIPGQAEKDLDGLNKLIKAKGYLDSKDLQKFPRTQFYIAHYRGINYMKDRWGTQARRLHYRKDEQGQLQFSESILNLLFSKGCSIFTDKTEQKMDISKYSSDLTEESKKLQKFLITLEHTSPCIAKTDPRNDNLDCFYYDSVGDACQNLSSNGIKDHLNEISRLRKKYPYWKENLPNALNYRISMSDTPYHAIRYAIGAKTYYGTVAIPRYHGNGSPEFKHVGKCYLFLEPLKELAESEHIKRLFHLQRNGRLAINPFIFNEREVAYLGYTPNPVFSHITIKYPNFSKKEHYRKFGMTQTLFSSFKKAIKITRPYTPENDMVIKLLTQWLSVFYEKQMISLAENFQLGIIVYWHADGCLGTKPDPNWNRPGEANYDSKEKNKSLRKQRKEKAEELLNFNNQDSTTLDNKTIPGFQLVSKKTQRNKNYQSIFNENEHKLKSYVDLFEKEQVAAQKIRLPSKAEKKSNIQENKKIVFQFKNDNLITNTTPPPTKTIVSPI